MKEIYYLSSTGIKINLILQPYKMLTATDLFNYEWEVVSVGQNFPQVKGFKSQMYSRKITLRVTGNTENEMLANLERLTEIVDADVRNNTIGRIYYGDYYRDCFVVGNEKPSKFLKKKHTNITLTLLSPDGDWKQEKPQIYSGLSGGVNVNNSCYPSVSSETDWEYSPQLTGETNVRWESLDSIQVDVALNQEADSPEYSTGHTPAMAVDGDMSTYFEIPSSATDKSLVVTFDKVYRLKTFLLKNASFGNAKLYDYSTGERGFYFGRITTIGSDDGIMIEPTEVSAVEVVFESSSAVTVVEFVVYEDRELDSKPTLLIDLGAILNIDTIGSLSATTLETAYLESSEDGETWDSLDSGSGSHTFYWHQTV